MITPMKLKLFLHFSLFGFSSLCQIVKLEGYLVRIDGKNGYVWESSLTRNDTGAHACEVVFVKSIER